MSPWLAYRGTGVPGEHSALPLPDPPPWRVFDGGPPVEPDFGAPRSGGTASRRGRTFQADAAEVDMVNAALYLRRPLLVTGGPGTGKSTLAYSVAEELALGPVLRWSVTSRSTLHEALYGYDAIGRLQDANLDGGAPDVGRYLRLGPLGTALLPTERPRVLVVDELDKSDIDLPNDLLDIFEEGEYEIPELSRLTRPVVEVTTADGGARVPVRGGRVRCRAFPLVVLTSNGEREFPPAFLRRCLRLHVPPPDEAKLRRIVAAQLGEDALEVGSTLIADFLSRREKGELATDQLLNAVHLALSGLRPPGETREQLAEALLPHLGSG
ncbi:MoxR family ATPase [Actinosynnema sp. NPDC020468]|uniref:AAA family ATPase n=1 Tax=Actinosynnema sp. NPDC020468 TaxID=3154488 RepID=UPI0033EE6F00